MVASVHPGRTPKMGERGPFLSVASEVTGLSGRPVLAHTSSVSGIPLCACLLHRGTGEDECPRYPSQGYCEDYPS